MAHFNEHLLVKLRKQNGVLCDTLLPMTPGRMKRCWRGGNEGEAKTFYVFCFVLVFVCLFDCFVLSQLDFLKVSFGGHCRDEGKIWGDWELSRIRVHDMKFPKNQ